MSICSILGSFEHSSLQCHHAATDLGSRGKLGLLASGTHLFSVTWHGSCWVVSRFQQWWLCTD